MATAPKAAAKVVPIDENKGAPPKKSKQLILLLLILALGLGGGAGAWFYFSAQQPAKPKQQPPKPPVFLPLDQFTVNLQQDGNIDQFLQIAFTLQLPGQEQVEEIKQYMPLVRSRLLLLLSSKKASEISSLEGKKKLSEEIIEQIKKPFTPDGKQQAVTGVFITSFVIQ